MQIANNQTCIFCGKRIENLDKGVAAWAWYVNCSSEGDWGVAIVHRECIKECAVKPMIDDGDIGKLNEPK